MASKLYVKLSPKASIFYDQASKIKVLRKEVVELTDKQFNLRVIKAALANGYLIEAKAEEFKAPGSKESSPAPKKGVDLEAVRKKFDELVEAEEAPEKIKEQFNTDISGFPMPFAGQFIDFKTVMIRQLPFISGPCLLQSLCLMRSQILIRSHIFCCLNLFFRYPGHYRIAS